MTESLTEETTTDAAVDKELLEELLLGRWAETRRASRAVAADPQFHKVEGITKEDHRERVLKQLHGLVEAGAIQRAFPRSSGARTPTGRTSPPSRRW